MGAGIEPGIASAHDFHLQLLLLEVAAVDIGDFEFAAGRGLDVGRNAANLGIVKVQAGDRIVGLGCLGFFFDTDRALLSIELHHAIALRIVHMVGKHGGTAQAGLRAGQLLDQIVPVEDVVAQYQGAGVRTHKLATDDEGLRQAIRTGLHRILDLHAPVGAVAQQLLEARRILRGGDDQHLANPAQHQRGERVVDHRLVVHRQQLLGHGLRHGIQASARTAGEDDAFAGGRGVHAARLLSSSSVLRTPACQSGKMTPKVCSNCDTSSREFKGRCAGVG